MSVLHMLHCRIGTVKYIMNYCYTTLCCDKLYYLFLIPSESLVSLEPHSVVLRTMEHNQAQCDMPYGEQVVAQPPMIRADVQSRQGVH